MQPKTNIAARMGRWSAQHRKTAIGGWLGFVIAATMFGGAIGTNEIKNSDAGVGDSGRAAQIMDTAFADLSVGPSETLLVQSDKLNSGDAAFVAAVNDAVARLQKTAHVADVVSPYAAGATEQISRDGHTAIVQFSIRGDEETAEDRVAASLATTAAVAKAHPQLFVGQSGDVSTNKAVTDKDDAESQKAELMSLPFMLLILIIAFGALMAAGVPILLALSGVIGTLGLVGPLSQIAPVSPSISAMIMMIGLAVGVDYSLFYVRREREERAAGRSEEAALNAAAATSGRAVLVSGFTVMIAMGGMYLAGNSMFTSFATGSIAAVAVAMIGSLTVLPALLSLMGDRINKGRIPFMGRIKARIGEYGMWSRIIDRVMRRPLASALISGGLLVALSLPVLGMHTALPGMETLPRDVAEVQTYDKVQAAFPSEAMPTIVVVKAKDVTHGPVAAAIADLKSQAAQRADLFTGPPTVEVSDDKRVTAIAFPTVGNGTDAKSTRTLNELRNDLVPGTVGKVADEALVTGTAAFTKDFNDSMNSHLIYVFAFVLSAAFLLLLVTFRSIVIAVKAIVLNMLSVGAAYGLLVLTFQKGWGESLLGFESTGAVTGWLPLFLFVVLFGLSMDYHVFILSRVREAYDKGMSTADAVSHGIKSTAGVVTSAALVMVVVFGSFAMQSSIDMKQLGFGLAVAVLIDATIIRAILLPATMRLLGDWNWWLPKKLGWLPQVTHEPEVAPAQA